MEWSAASSRCDDGEAERRVFMAHRPDHAGLKARIRPHAFSMIEKIDTYWGCTYVPVRVVAPQ